MGNQPGAYSLSLSNEQQFCHHVSEESGKHNRPGIEWSQQEMGHHVLVWQWSMCGCKLQLMQGKIVWFRFG